MTDYNVNYTDIQTTPIPMQEGTENNTTLDIAIFGNTFLEYGQELNENILHLLENFSCPMNAGNQLTNATPDTHSVNGSYNHLLTHPTKGQIWYNSSLKKLYYWDGTRWLPISTKNDVAANWGVIIDGAQLPKPVSATTGYVFPYSECIWSISPANFAGTFDYMACSTDHVATVNMKYRLAGNSSLTSSVANYLIIGIRGNTNHGVGVALTPPVPSASATSTPPAPTASPTNTPTPSVSPTPSTSLSQTPIPTGTAQPTPSASPSHSHTPTPTHTRTPTPTPSHTRTPAASASQTPPSLSSSNTPTRTPTPTPTPIHPLTIPTYGPTSLQLFGAACWPGAGHTLTATTGVACNGGTFPNAASFVNVSGGVPPYTYQWQYYSGSLAFSIDSPTTSSTIYHANGVTPTISGGSCTGCTTDAGAGCPTPDGLNVTCVQTRCKVTDSVGSIVYSPIFNLAFYFENNN